MPLMPDEIEEVKQIVRDEMNRRRTAQKNFRDGQRRKHPEFYIVNKHGTAIVISPLNAPQRH